MLTWTAKEIEITEVRATQARQQEDCSVEVPLMLSGWLSGGQVVKAAGIATFRTVYVVVRPEDLEDKGE
jgi:hypothetical protein